MNNQRVKIFEIKQAYLPLLIYSFLSIVVLIPLLKPGYIFTLDSTQIFTNPISRFFYPDQGVLTTSAGIAVDVFNFLFNHIFPAWIFDKILLFGIFLLAGLGAHRLVDTKGIGSYFAGVLYVINPFTYIRFMAGQWGLLWAYALIPFGVKSILELMDSRSIKTAIKMAVLTTLVGLLDIHGYFLLILIFIILSVVRLISNNNTPLQIRQTGKVIAISVGMFLLLNLYWLVPVLTAQGTLLNQIGKADLLFFAPHSTGAFGITFDIASLWGFWRTGYLVPGNYFPFWWIPFIYILFLAVYGALSHRSHRQWLTLSLAITGIIAFLLAVGAASNLTYPMFDWLWQNIPFFNGFRDSQKFVALLCLAYAILCGLGINLLIRSWGGLKQHTTGTVFLVVFSFVALLTYTFPMLGFHRQLETTDYPKEWYAVKEYLDQDKTDFNIWFLPWHEYMNFSWLPNSDKRLANPAQQFFDKPMIIGDNMESGGIYSESTNPISKYVEFLLNNGTHVDNMGELLAPLDVKYIILVDEADYQIYNYLYKQQDLKIIMEEPGITLLENEHPTARTYAVDSVVHIKSLDDYLELSQTQDVMEHIYSISNGQDTGNTDSIEIIDTIENNPVTYQIGATSQNYTVFTIPQNVSTQNWEYNGQKPALSNLGFMPVFTSFPNGGKIVNTKFYRVYLPCDIVSFLTFFGMIILYIKKPKARTY